MDAAENVVSSWDFANGLHRVFILHYLESDADLAEMRVKVSCPSEESVWVNVDGLPVERD